MTLQSFANSGIQAFIASGLQARSGESIITITFASFVTGCYGTGPWTDPDGGADLDILKVTSFTYLTDVEIEVDVSDFKVGTVTFDFWRLPHLPPEYGGSDPADGSRTIDIFTTLTATSDYDLNVYDNEFAFSYFTKSNMTLPISNPIANGQTACNFGAGVASYNGTGSLNGLS